jgi:DNA invertase Pin-like site-specific DNA recombinase
MVKRARLDIPKKMPRHSRRKSSALAIAYIRVSTDEQVLSPDAQRSDINAWAAENGIEIASWHEDIGVSGRTPVEERPGLLAALEDRHRFKAPFIVIAARDRISRDMHLTMRLEYELKRNKARLITAREEATDELTPEARALQGVMDVFAELEAAMIRRRTQAALKVAKENGVILGRPGMLRSPLGREMIAWVHDLAAAGYHSARIIRYMEYKFGRTTYGRSWGPQLIQRCLKQPRPPEFLQMEIDHTLDV